MFKYSHPRRCRWDREVDIYSVSLSFVLFIGLGLLYWLISANLHIGRTQHAIHILMGNGLSSCIATGAPLFCLLKLPRVSLPMPSVLANGGLELARPLSPVILSASMLSKASSDLFPHLKNLLSIDLCSHLILPISCCCWRKDTFCGDGVSVPLKCRWILLILCLSLISTTPNRMICSLKYSGYWVMLQMKLCGNKVGELISVKKEIGWKCWKRIHLLSFCSVRLDTYYFLSLVYISFGSRDC